MQVLSIIPERRDSILYTRVTAENKKFIEELSEFEGVSESALVDHILMLFRTSYAGNTKKQTRGT